MDLCNQEACWYNFETRSRDWQDPWHETAEHTALMMHGHSYQQTEKGESGSYHIYFYVRIRMRRATPTAREGGAANRILQYVGIGFDRPSPQRALQQVGTPKSFFSLRCAAWG